MSKYLKIFIVVLTFLSLLFAYQLYSSYKKAEHHSSSMAEFSHHSPFCRTVDEHGLVALKVQGTYVEDGETFDYSYEFKTSGLPSPEKLKSYINDLIIVACDSQTYPMTSDFEFDPRIWQISKEDEIKIEPYTFLVKSDEVIMSLSYVPSPREGFQSKDDCLSQPLFAAMDEIKFQVKFENQHQAFENDSSSYLCLGQFDSQDRWELVQ